jgi:hypothetical protein
MSWQDLLTDEGHVDILPWFGFRQIHDFHRTWTLEGTEPREHGWYKFFTGGTRTARLAKNELCSPDPKFIDVVHPKFRGYIVGDRFIPDSTGVSPDPTKLFEQTQQVFCVERGLPRFARATVFEDLSHHLVFWQQEFPYGPEEEALRAYQDRKPNLNHVKMVSTSLDLAFQWISYQREQIEAREREMARRRAAEEAKRAEEERYTKALKDASTAVGRRVLATRDFKTAAQEALKLSGAELLDTRESYNKHEMIVQYLFRHQRFECVVDKQTLQVVDSGICLTSHTTGIKGDTWFTLESLPGVIGEAIDSHKLVVYRHVGDDGEAYNDREDWDDDD